MAAQQEAPAVSPKRVWVVAGASRGIGEQYVAQARHAQTSVRGYLQTVLKAGDAVVAAARRPEQSPGLTGLKTEHGAALQLVKLDVNDGASLKAAAEEVAREHPDGIDFLIVNAGVVDPKHKSGIATEVNTLQYVVETNVFGAFATIQAFYPLLKMKTDGVKAIVTMSSSVAQMGRVSESARALDTPLAPFDKFQFAYKVSKSALNQVTIQLANELKGEGFTIIAMHPGTVDTDILTEVRNGSGPELGSLLKNRAISAAQSVGSQLAYLATASQARDNGRYVDWNGKTMDW